MSNGFVTIPTTTVDATGVHVPVFADIVTALQTNYGVIYGSDIDWDNSTQDAQFIGLIATAINNANMTAGAVYNSFSPSTAQGIGLSTNVKLNGITRNVASYSTVGVLIIGEIGTTITNGVVEDNNGNLWSLPSSVTIPSAGQITVTATAQQIGALLAAPNTITTIYSIGVPGWQSVTNSSAASPGAPVETDAALKARQSISASLPALGPTLALQAALETVPNVSAIRIYENSASATDSTWGIPGHSLAVVVSGGDITTIAGLISLKKSQGVNTYGNLAIQLPADAAGIIRTINYSIPTQVPITFSLTIYTLTGFTTDIQAQIQASLANWANAGGIGGYLGIADAYMAARLYGGTNSNTFRIVPDTLLMARDGGVPTAADLPMAYDEMPTSSAVNVSIKLSNTTPPAGYLGNI